MSRRLPSVIIARKILPFPSVGNAVPPGPASVRFGEPLLVRSPVVSRVLPPLARWYVLRAVCLSLIEEDARRGIVHAPLGRTDCPSLARGTHLPAKDGPR